jgi:hypothetical protein
MSKKGHKIVSVIICDDIRKEASGKQTLVGVYNKDIIIPNIPSTLSQLFFRVGIELERTDFKRIHFVVTSPSRKKVGDQSGEITIQDGTNHLTLGLKAEQPTFVETGTYTIRLGLDASARKIGEFIARLPETDMEQAKIIS